jgi:hypothetical protein
MSHDCTTISPGTGTLSVAAVGLQHVITQGAWVHLVEPNGREDASPAGAAASLARRSCPSIQHLPGVSCNSRASRRFHLAKKLSCDRSSTSRVSPPVWCIGAAPVVRNPLGSPSGRGSRLRRVFDNLLLEETAEGDEFVANGVNHLKVVGSGTP